MDDLERYIEKRKQNDSEFADKYEEGYKDFELSVMLKEARLASGLTQDEVARRIHTTKSSISRIENHAEDIKLSTLERFAKALGKTLEVRIV